MLGNVSVAVQLLLGLGLGLVGGLMDGMALDVYKRQPPRGKPILENWRCTFPCPTLSLYSFCLLYTSRHSTTLSYEQCADQIDARVRESVAAHRISDVKVGSFLSGGVDSSYITCLLYTSRCV